ncbi:ABC transporter permease [Natronorubrum aibiense]|uniref:FtsX-like permease family protein n=1 Tax=Natronorubrum aibiense TaxID=348826 RepID=A0A5P9P6Q7_9EURY|nr:ABC transporter permease [Natronorubrum aibiense]QFU83776.1 FtsX-like permease family protein [Natronorubrum aibiense]
MAADDRFDVASTGTRRARWRGLVGLEVVRLWRRTIRTRSGRLVATIGAVALTIALLVIVTGIALGLADGSAVTHDDADVRITPEGSATLSAVDGVEGPRLGATNERAETIRADDGVAHASPVLVEPVQLEAADGEARTILFVGVVPDDEPRTVGGLSTESLEPGDPQYANGSYNGSRTGEIVLSATAADRLEADTDATLTVSGPHRSSETPASSFTATAVETGDGNTDDAASPVALVHLSDLQTIAGASDGQLADHVLVWGESDAATTAATEAYPDATVQSTGGTDPSALFGDGLAFATSLLALVVGVTICASFVATTAGMTVNEDRRTLAVLESVGYPTHSRLTIIAVSTLLTTLCGALVGVILGIGGIHALNAAASATVAPGAVAQVHPVIVPYAIGVAIVSGLVAVPYPLAVAARTSVLSEVGR